ncbi:MAG: hypothetical protein ACLTSZ_03755 [Lachnospiraceae bacterium]
MEYGLGSFQKRMIEDDSLADRILPAEAGRSVRYRYVRIQGHLRF